MRTVSVGNWQDGYYLKCHQLAKEGLDDVAIASALGVKSGTFKRWVEKKPALAEALESARGKNGGVKKLKEIIVGKLPAAGRKLWEKLEEIDGAMERIERRKAAWRFTTQSREMDALEQDGRDMDEGERALLAVERREILRLMDGATDRIRQHLFVQALISSNFMVSQACRKIGMSTDKVKAWKANDRAFSQVLEAVQEAKRDFYEGSLVELVHRGDSAATIFANKTLNRTRGYGEKIEVESVSTVKHEHTLSFDEIPMEARKAMLEALRKKKELPRLEDRSNVQDAEWSEK